MKMEKEEYVTLNGREYPTVNGKKYNEKTLRHCDLNKLKRNQIRGFLDFGINPNLPDKKGQTLLDWCICHEDEPLVKQCLDQGGNPNHLCKVAINEEEERINISKTIGNVLFNTFAIGAQSAIIGAVGGVLGAVAFSTLPCLHSVLDYVFSGASEPLLPMLARAAAIGFGSGFGTGFFWTAVLTTGLCIKDQDTIERHIVKKRVSHEYPYLAIAAEKGNYYITQMLLAKGALPSAIDEVQRGELSKYPYSEEHQIDACYSEIKRAKSIYKENPNPDPEKLYHSFWPKKQEIVFEFLDLAYSHQFVEAISNFNCQRTICHHDAATNKNARMQYTKMKER